MKFVKGISLFFVYPVIMFGLGFYTGMECMHFFYPGATKVQEERELAEQEWTDIKPDSAQLYSPESYAEEISDELVDVASEGETLSVDTEYVLEETDMVNDSVVETVSRLPREYVGLDRKQFLEAMEEYETYPPLSEVERGFVSLEVLSFSRERVVVQMNYQYLQPSNSFYLAVLDNEVVVYLEDMETVYIYTGIRLEELPEEVQMEIIQMLWIEDEETLYQFLENYSS